MSEDSTNTATSDGPQEVREAGKLIRSFGLILSNSFLYGVAHGVTVKALEDGFETVTRCLAECPEITIQITDESTVLVNEGAVEQKNPLMRNFVTRLSALGVNTFSLIQGLTHETFVHLVEVFNAKPEEIKQLGGFAATITSFGLENIRAKTVTYQKVAEDEVVVDKGAVKIGGELGSAEAEAVISFLGGTGPGSGDDSGVVKAMAGVASSPSKLGDLILKAADAREEASATGEASGDDDQDEGKQFTDFVVDTMHKAFDGLSHAPSMKTQKAKKALIKTLRGLESEILTKLREARGVVDEVEAKKVTDAIELMEEDLTIDELASAYAKKVSAIEANEKRLLRFIKSKGLDGVEGTDLRERFMDGGISPEGWSELLSKSGLDATGAAGSGGGIAAVGHLAMLLAEMEKDVGSGVAEDQLAGVLDGVHEEVRKMVVKTERKILDLVESVKEAADGVDDETPGPEAAAKRAMSRKRMLEVLAEIAQELCQPLAVINCSIDMIKGGGMGDINDQQKDMLGLASESGVKLGTLIDRLTEISGMPSSTSPDAAIQDSLYDADTSVS